MPGTLYTFVTAGTIIVFWGKCQFTVIVLLLLGEVSEKKLHTGHEEILVKLNEPNVGIVILVFWKNVILFSAYINPLKTKHRLLYLKTQSIRHSKHFSSRL
jgi:hypothetical protein